MENKFLITFAGPMGSSKTPIAYYLSYRLNIPIFSNDCIRTEVIADTGMLDEREYLRRRDARLEDIGHRGLSFIYDASVDREWDKLKEGIKPLGYRTFVISIDLSKKFLMDLYTRGMEHDRGYAKYLVRIDDSLAEHKSFLANHPSEVGLHINDENFADRLELCDEKVKTWLGVQAGEIVS